MELAAIEHICKNVDAFSNVASDFPHVLTCGNMASFCTQTLIPKARKNQIDARKFRSFSNPTFNKYSNLFMTYSYLVSIIVLGLIITVSMVYLLQICLPVWALGIRRDFAT